MKLGEGQLFAKRYRIEAQIGKGAYGSVYRARDTTLDSRVALKVLRWDAIESESVREHFLLEARVSGRVESDHIVKIFDVGTDEETGAPYLVMELLTGSTLQQLIEVNGPLRPDLVVTYLRQLARGLDKAHGYVSPEGENLPIVHRDLKPDNLFVTRRDDGTPCLKILDFGIAKLLQSSMTVTVAGKGTPVYMAFEQAAGKQLTRATDIWAFGLIAFTLLAGRPFWRAANRRHGVEALYAEVLSLDIPRPSLRVRDFTEGQFLPEAFDDWFAKCVNRDPSSRFGSAGAAAEELEKALRGMPSRAGDVAWGKGGETSRPWNDAPLSATGPGAGALSTGSPSLAVSSGTLSPASTGADVSSSAHLSSTDRPWALPRNWNELGHQWRSLCSVLAVLVAVSGGVWGLLAGRDGSIALTVAGPRGEALDKVELFVDGNRVCEHSPCRALVRPGPHVVSVSAPGFAAPPSETLTVKAGAETALHMAFQAALRGTLEVSAVPSGLSLSIDGRDIGPLPQRVDGLVAGVHEVRIAGSRQFAEVRRSVTIEPGRSLNLGAIAPPVLFGTLSVTLAKSAQGAKLRLLSGDYSRECPKAPFTLEVDTARKTVITAKKPGYEAFAQEIHFPDGQGVLSLEVGLQKPGAAAPLGVQPTPRAGAQPAAPARAPLAATEAPPVVESLARSEVSTTEPSAQAQLNIQSMPKSNVTLDGRALGSTPRFGVAVTVGNHQILFVHPERGQKQISVSVAPGESKNVSVQF